MNKNKMTIDKAGWAFRQIKEAQEEINKNQLYADREIDRIKDWLDKENAPLENRIAYFSAMVEDFYRDLKAIDPGAKLSTPYGKVTTRTSRYVEWGNEEALLDWLKASGHNNYIRTKESLDKVALKKDFLPTGGGLVTMDGEIYPGAKAYEKTTYKVVVD